MIFESIQFQFDENGRTENSKPIGLKGINLFVGANNSGKTFALNEIDVYFESVLQPTEEIELEEYRKAGNKIFKKHESIFELSISYNNTVFKQLETIIKYDFWNSEDLKRFSQKQKPTILKNKLNSFYASYRRDISFFQDSMQIGALKKKEVINFTKINSTLVDKNRFIRFNNINNKRERRLNENSTTENIDSSLHNYFILLLNKLKRKYKSNIAKKIWTLKWINSKSYLKHISKEFITAFSLKADTIQFSYSSNVPRIMVEEFSKVRSIIEKKLGFILSIDFNQLNTNTYRVCQDDKYKEHELSLEKKSEEYFAKQPLLYTFSDGIKSIIGLLLKIFSSKSSVFLLDEPDILLHPPYARKLGSILASHSKDFNSQFFIATHNQNLLQGFLESGEDVNVFRFSYKNNIPKINVLDSKQLKSLIKDAKFRFSGILESIFSDGVILVEGESDRRVYYQTLELYLNQNPIERIDGLNFVCAGGKDKVAEIAGHLKRLGIPTVIILDADALTNDVIKDIVSQIRSKDSGENIESLKSTFLKQLDIQLKIENKDNQSIPQKDNYLQEKGIEKLSKDTKDSFDSLNMILKKNGIFIVPQGDLEKTIPVLWNECIETNEEKRKKEWEEKAIQLLIEAEANNKLPKYPLITIVQEVNRNLRAIINAG